MKIKDLPDNIKQAALENQFHAGNTPNEDLFLSFIEVDGNFDWNSTPEGYHFWNLIYSNCFEAAYEICPHLRPDDVNDIDVVNTLGHELKITELKDELLSFLFYLNDEGLINNHDFDYQVQVDKYIKNLKSK
jgi:hypothetical protein